MWSIKLEDIHRAKGQLQARRAKIEAKYLEDMKTLDADIAEIRGACKPRLGECRHRLFTTPQGSKSVMVFDLRTHKLIHTIGGIEIPNGLLCAASAQSRACVQRFERIASGLHAIFFT